MPRLDIYHKTVRNALEKDGWVITHDPFLLFADRGSYSMAAQLNYSSIIKEILLDYVRYKSAYGDILSSVSFDDEHGKVVMKLRC